MDAAEQDDLPSTKKPKVSDDSIETGDSGAVKPEITTDPIENADNEAAPTVCNSVSQYFLLSKLTVDFYFSAGRSIETTTEKAFETGRLGGEKEGETVKGAREI